MTVGFSDRLAERIKRECGGHSDDDCDTRCQNCGRCTVHPWTYEDDEGDRAVNAMQDASAR